MFRIFFEPVVCLGTQDKLGTHSHDLKGEVWVADSCNILIKVRYSKSHMNYIVYNSGGTNKRQGKTGERAEWLGICKANTDRREWYCLKELQSLHRRRRITKNSRCW